MAANRVASARVPTVVWAVPPPASHEDGLHHLGRLRHTGGLDVPRRMHLSGACDWIAPLFGLGFLGDREDDGTVTEDTTLLVTQNRITL